MDFKFDHDFLHNGVKMCGIKKADNFMENWRLDFFKGVKDAFDEFQRFITKPDNNFSIKEFEDP